MELGHVVSQVGCARCGRACHPLQARCTSCGADPLGEVALRLNALSWKRFALSSVIVLSLIGSILGLLLGDGSSWVGQLMRAVPFLQVVLTVLLVAFALSLVGHLVGLWQATRASVVLHPERGVILLRRARDGVYLHQIGWHELAPPLPPRRQNWLNLLTHLVHLASGGLSHAIALVLLDTPTEYHLIRTTAPNQPIRFFTTISSFREGAFLSILSAHCLDTWMASGRITIDPEFAPTHERPILIVDLTTCKLRAYAKNQVILDEKPYEYESAESHNPDGTRVEPDQSLPPPAEREPTDDTEYQPIGRQRIAKAGAVQVYLPIFAVPYKNGYWVRAGWNLIAKLESRRKASETASQMPDNQPRPA